MEIKQNPHAGMTARGFLFDVSPLGTAKAVPSPHQLKWFGMSCEGFAESI